MVKDAEIALLLAEDSPALDKLWERYHAEERAIVADALRLGGSLKGAARLLRIQVSSMQRILQRHPDLDAKRHESTGVRRRAA